MNGWIETKWIWDWQYIKPNIPRSRRGAWPSKGCETKHGNPILEQLGHISNSDTLKVLMCISDSCTQQETFQISPFLYLDWVTRNKRMRGSQGCGNRINCVLGSRCDKITGTYTDSAKVLWNQSWMWHETSFSWIGYHQFGSPTAWFLNECSCLLQYELNSTVVFLKLSRLEL